MANKKTVSRIDKAGSTKRYKYVEIKRDVGDGIRRSFTGKTKREAEEKYEEAKKEYILRRSTNSFEQSEVLFEDWAAKWLEVYKKHTTKPLTYNGTYRSPTQTHIIPFFKGKKLKDIKQSDIQEFFNSIKEYSYSTQHKCDLCIKGIFTAAVGDKLIFSNPAQKPILSKSSADTIRQKISLSYEQARMVIEFAKSHQFGLDVICMLKSGMRRAELVAMPFHMGNETYDKTSKLNGGIDLDKKCFCVRQSINETKEGISFEPCKSKRSRRNIPFNDEMYDLLVAESGIIAFKTSSKKYPRKYLVAGKYGSYMRPSNWDRRFAQFVDAFDLYAEAKNLGFKMIPPHWLRFSFGSILYKKTKDIVTVSRLMGHSSIEITAKLYIDEDEEALREAIENGI